MTRKCAMAGLANGGGKTVVAVPDGVTLDRAVRADVLSDVGDLIASLDGRYATGPDAGTTPRDMAVTGERTGHVFCPPPQLGGSGDSSPHTATGVVAALHAVCARVHGSPDLGQRHLAIVGLGSVGTHLARQLTATGAELTVSDFDPAKQALAEDLGAWWAEPADALTAEVDVLIPAALGGVLTSGILPRLRCAAIAGPANNQLAEPAVAGLLHQRRIIWVADYIAGAGGVIYALAVELHKETPRSALARVQAIEQTVDLPLDTANRTGADPNQAALELAAHRVNADALSPAHRQPGSKSA